MPVTKTAKRALRSSKRKEKVNKKIISDLEAAIREAKREKTKEKILRAISLTDRAAKKDVIHNNKAARIKSSLSTLKKGLYEKKKKSSTKSKKKKGKK